MPHGYTITDYCGHVKGHVEEEVWTTEVDYLLGLVEGMTDAEAAEELDISESRFRGWKNDRKAGKPIIGETRGKPRKALMRARAGLEIRARISREVQGAIKTYLPDHLRRAFMEATDPSILRGLHTVLTAIEEIPPDDRRLIARDLDRRISEAEAQR